MIGLRAAPGFTTTSPTPKCSVVDENGICIALQNTMPRVPSPGGGGKVTSRFAAKLAQLFQPKPHPMDPFQIGPVGTNMPQPGAPTPPPPSVVEVIDPATGLPVSAPGSQPPPVGLPTQQLPPGTQVTNVEPDGYTYETDRMLFGVPLWKLGLVAAGTVLAGATVAVAIGKRRKRLTP